MANIGQTILIRTDLFGDNVGLIAAQVAHIHAKLMYDLIKDEIMATQTVIDWAHQPYIFVKKVPNELGLIHYKKLAEQAGVAVAEWKDTVYVNLSKTQMQAFEGVLVGISLGPDDADKIRTVVGDLPLL